jgi:hypothetical protein
MTRTGAIGWHCSGIKFRVRSKAFPTRAGCAILPRPQPPPRPPCPSTPRDPSSARLAPWPPGIRFLDSPTERILQNQLPSRPDHPARTLTGAGQAVDADLAERSVRAISQRSAGRGMPRGSGASPESGSRCGAVGNRPGRGSVGFKAPPAPAGRDHLLGGQTSAGPHQKPHNHSPPTRAA